VAARGGQTGADHLSSKPRLVLPTAPQIGRGGRSVESTELAPVGSSYVLVRVGSGRSVLSLQGRELWGILIKGNYDKRAKSSALRTTET
jgi:hypothetical protein